MKTTQLTTLILATVLLCACRNATVAPAAENVAESSKTRGCRDVPPNKAKTTTQAPASMPKIVTFNDHVLPLLASQADDRVFKCTVCHDQYRAIETVREQLDRIIASVESKRMPIGGTPMGADEIALLSQWRDDGFQPGGAVDAGIALQAKSGCEADSED